MFNPIINILLKKITDSTCGFRMFRVDIFKNFKKIFLKKNYLLMDMNILAMVKY